MSSLALVALLVVHNFGALAGDTDVCWSILVDYFNHYDTVLDSLVSVWLCHVTMQVITGGVNVYLAVIRYPIIFTDSNNRTKFSNLLLIISLA